MWRADVCVCVCVCVGGGVCVGGWCMCGVVCMSCGGRVYVGEGCMCVGQCVRWVGEGREEGVCVGMGWQEGVGR